MVDDIETATYLSYGRANDNGAELDDKHCGACLEAVSTNGKSFLKRKGFVLHQYQMQISIETVNIWIRSSPDVHHQDETSRIRRLTMGYRLDVKGSTIVGDGCSTMKGTATVALLLPGDSTTGKRE